MQPTYNTHHLKQVLGRPIVRVFVETRDQVQTCDLVLVGVDIRGGVLDNGRLDVGPSVVRLSLEEIPLGYFVIDFEVFDLTGEGAGQIRVENYLFENGLFHNAARVEDLRVEAHRVGQGDHLGRS